MFVIQLIFLFLPNGYKYSLSLAQTRHLLLLLLSKIDISNPSKIELTSASLVTTYCPLRSKMNKQKTKREGSTEEGDHYNLFIEHQACLFPSLSKLTRGASNSDKFGTVSSSVHHACTQHVLSFVASLIVYLQFIVISSLNKYIFESLFLFLNFISKNR